LDEAADRNGNFERLGRAWMPVYAGLTCVGVLFAFFAPEIVTLLSHGKFTAAAPLVPIWIAYILLQNAAKAATATLCSLGRGASVSRAQMVSTMLGIVLLVVLVPFFGQWGAVGSLFASMFAFRVIMNAMASRVRSLPFRDGWVIGGSIVILAATAVETFLVPSLALKSVLCGATLGIVGILARDTLIDLFGQVCRHIWATPLWSRLAPR
jgi:O-antigen/teichoic acid export membrane protein